MIRYGNQFFSLSLDMQCVADYDGNLVELNDAWSEILGWTAKELQSHSLLELVHPDDIEATKNEILKVKSGNLSQRFENRVCHCDGTYRRLLWNAKASVDYPLLFAVARDITEARLREEQLERDHSRLQQILDSVDDFILLKGSGSRILWVNRSFREYYGMSNEELQNLIDAPTTPPDLTQQYIKDDAYVFSTGTRLDIPSEKVRRFDGEIREFHTVKSPIFDESGKVAMTVGVSRDVTKLRTIERQLEEEHQNLKRANAEIQAQSRHMTEILSLAPATFYSYGLKGSSLSPIYVSPNLYDAFGYKPSLFIQDADFWMDKVHPEDRAQVMSKTNTLLQKGRASNKYRVRKNDSTYIWVQDHSVLKRNAEGAPCEVYGFWTDISREKEDEAIIEKQRLQIIQSSKMTSLGEMAGAIAHEINNPLAIIQGRTQQLRSLVEDKEFNPELFVNWLNVIEATTKRVAKIIKSLRTFARDGDNDPFEDRLLTELINDSIAMCEMKFRNHGIRLQTEGLDASLTVPCRQVALVQVLVNLLNNAFDAIENLPEKWIRISCNIDDDYVHVMVTDSGSGIAQEIREKITLPFFTTKEVGKGTGLGLSISKSIIEDHQGRISIDANSPNTCFVISLPRHQKNMKAKPKGKFSAA